MCAVADPIPRDFRIYIENLYSQIPKGDLEHVLDNLIFLLELGKDRRQSLRSFLDQVARMIFKLFDVEEISIGLKDRKEDRWRYEIVFGYTRAVEAKVRKLEYNRADMYEFDTYPNVKIGRLSELNPVEGMPELEADAYNRPYRVGEKRQSVDDFHEGDFVDFWVYGPGKEIIAWIELSRPKNGKMLPRANVRWIELIAGACSPIILQKWKAESKKEVP